MAAVVPAPPALSSDLSIYHTTDPLLSNSPVLVLYGAASTIGATSSRIQAHIFTPAGHASYARLAVSPNSPFYSAVSDLPRDEQGDEVVRGLAFSLKKYFVELSEAVKTTWCVEAKAPAASALFGDAHVAILASRMRAVQNVEGVIQDIRRTFGEQKLSWQDIDVVLPSGTIKGRPADASSEDADSAHMLAQRYGRYAELIDSLGEVAFFPTTKVKRAPSKISVLNRSPSFLKVQKENVRKQVQELLLTEVSYVERMNELSGLSNRMLAEASHSDRAQLTALFSPAITQIATLNLHFLEELRGVIEATENAAERDIQATAEIESLPLRAREEYVADPQGLAIIANCLRRWLPKFSDAYRDYTRSHNESTQMLRELLHNETSALGPRLQEIGEQKLSSLLIEPVQKLPRYTLYINSIVKQLPTRHPAVKALLSARDIVTEICDHGDMATAAATAIARLRARIEDWPVEAPIAGRLITACDYVKLLPPYGAKSCESDKGLLLVFTDGLVSLRKLSANAISAKNLFTELEFGHSTARSTVSSDLRFQASVPFACVQWVEMLDGQALQLMTGSEPASESGLPVGVAIDAMQVLRLEGAYERRAERLVEDLTKARLEGRFSEAERESPTWEVRLSDPVADAASLFSAVFEDSQVDYVQARAAKAPTRLIVDIDRHTTKPRAGREGIRTVAVVSPLRGGTWRLSIDSVDGSAAREELPLSELFNALRRKLAGLDILRFSIDQSKSTPCLLARNLDMLQSVELQFKPDEDATGKTSRPESVVRPPSPRKLFSTFLAGTGPANSSSTTLKKDIPSLGPSPSKIVPKPTSAILLPISHDIRPSSKDQQTPKSMTSLRSTEQDSGRVKRLEETLSAYLLALQARKGNIVGRNIRMRALADELAVNELYNSLMEDPNMMVYAAQAPVDVLFSAFEKFLNVAWKEQLGPVMPYNVIQSIQLQAETLFPADFDAFFKSTVSSLTPQNQRAFKNILKLLADLLDGTGNDSDRGTLTCAFAEVLVTEGNAHDYIALIDRFVDDPDTYFGEPLEDMQKGEGTSNAQKRPRSVNSASITSNTSSLRRKFGFGIGLLSRENSKSEPESKAAAVWRSLSKSTRGDANAVDTITRTALHRSHSTDVDFRNPQSRPVSQDGSMAAQRPPSSGDSLPSGVSSPQNPALSTIGEHPTFIPTPPPRKKRRSSLSDLKTLEFPQKASPAWSSPASRLPPLAQRFNVDKSLPSSPMHSTPSSKGGSGRFGSPTREPIRSKLPPSFRKENSPGPAKALDGVQQRPKSSEGRTADVVITARPMSGIPTFSPKGSSPPKHGTASTPVRIGLAERPGAENIIKKPSPHEEKSTRTAVTETGSPKKLRMQSPQKLRERLHNEQSAVTAAHASLQDELSKIGEELTSTPSRMGSIAMRPRGQGNQPDNMELAQRVLKMEGQLSTQVEELNSRLKAVQTDLSSSLSISETKCKKLDELYRESNGENEALYARFNDELGRILKAVRAGEGVDELKKKLKENQEEAAKLKRENGRLKRENIGLRAQLKE